MPLFCRHNRMTANCPICSREQEAERRASSPPRTRQAAAGGRARTGAARRGAGGRGGSALVTRRMAPRASDDGYRNPLVPGLRARADAERLGAALAAAAARLQPPGPYPEIAAEPDREQATWLAFLLALAGPEDPGLQQEILRERPAWASGELPALPEPLQRTAVAYRGWAERAGSQAAGFEGEPGWNPERRFGRAFERLALPGFPRGPRYELLVTLSAAGVYPIAAGALHLGRTDDATTLAAKRLLVSGDPLLLERRAAELARACELPIAALDRGLAGWGAGAPAEPAEPEPPAAVQAALGLR